MSEQEDRTAILHVVENLTGTIAQKQNLGKKWEKRQENNVTNQHNCMSNNCYLSVI